jgi:hypothetical protein
MLASLASLIPEWSSATRIAYDTVAGTPRFSSLTPPPVVHKLRVFHALLDEPAMVMVLLMGFERFGELWEFLPQPPFGHGRQFCGHHRFLIEQRLQNFLARYAEDITYHVAELNVGRLQYLLDPVLLALNHSDQFPAPAGQITKLHDARSGR